jgi:hypothetical protein
MPLTSKLVLAGLAAAVLIGGGAVVLYSNIATTPTPTATTTPPTGGGGTGGTICTQEAKQCPDGSYVGRTGPNCEFAACPTHPGILPYTSGIQGKVSLGPTCPVARTPPDPECADKGYATLVSVSRLGSSSIYATVKSDANGAFQFSLPPGSYTVSAAGGQTLPRCSSVTATVGPSGYVIADISCDTGIK